MQHPAEQTLAELIRERGRLPMGQALNILHALARVLDQAHRAGRTFQGFQPADVRVTEGRKVSLSQGEGRDPPYLAPEQLSGGETGPWTDQYALGVLAYEVLAGRPPFAGSPEVVRQQIAQGTLPSIRSFRPELAPGVEAVLQRALARDPQARYSHVVLFLRALERALVLQPAAEPPPAAAPAAKKAGRRRIWVLASILGSVALLAVAVALLPVVLLRAPSASPTAVPTPLSPSPTPGPPVVVRLNLGTEPPTLDPALASETTSVDVISNLFLGLTTFDAETSAVLPELATSWEASADATVWTFHLRDDASWVLYDPASGAFWRVRPVTAQDVVYGVRRSVMPETASDSAYLLHVIRNAEKINTTVVPTDTYDIEELGVKALDDHTVQFTLEYPAGFFPAIAAMWVAWPQPREAIEAYGHRWIEPGQILTNGAYGLREWTHDSHMTLIKNPYHYNAAEVQITTVDLVMIADAPTAFSMYEGGELDSAGVPLDELDRIEQDPVVGKQVVVAPYPCSYYYGFSMDRPPMDNVHVRRAFSMAIDRQGVLGDLFGDRLPPANAFAPPGVFGSPAGDPQVGVYFDPEKAREELALAGYPGGAGFPTVTLYPPCSPGHDEIGKRNRETWQEVLGVQVDVVDDCGVSTEVPMPARIEQFQAHLWGRGWCADYPDENNWVYEVFNPTRYQAPPDDLVRDYWNLPRMRLDDPQVGSFIQEFDELTRAAGREVDPTRRIEMYRRAEQLLVYEIAAIAPIHYYTRVEATRPYLHRDYPAFGGIEIGRWWTGR